jgi:hypothetical protein
MGWINVGLALIAAFIERGGDGDRPGGFAGQPSSKPRPPGGKPTGTAVSPPGQPRPGRGK